MRTAMQRSGRRPTNSESSESSESSEVSENRDWRVLQVEGLLEVRKVTFSSDSSRKWQSLWLVGENLIGAGLEPCCAEECLDLSQNILLLSREQSLSADSLVL